jgi:hypothetical protein
VDGVVRVVSLTGRHNVGTAAKCRSGPRAVDPTRTGLTGQQLEDLVSSLSLVIGWERSSCCRTYMG